MDNVKIQGFGEEAWSSMKDRIEGTVGALRVLEQALADQKLQETEEELGHVRRSIKSITALGEEIRKSVNREDFLYVHNQLNNVIYKTVQQLKLRIGGDLNLLIN